MKNKRFTKLNAICFLGILFIPLSVAAQTADEIVSKVLAARGGVARIKAVKAQRIRGTIDFGGGTQGPFLVELKRPGKMHIEISIQGQTLVRTFDGNAGWTINPFTEPKGIQPMSAEDIRNIADESDFDGPLVDYKEKGNKVELLGQEEIAGKPAYRLKLTNKNGDVRSYLVDAKTFLLMRWEGTRKIGDKEVPWESLFYDYREVSGLQYAFEIDSDAPGTEQSQKIIAEKIEVDPLIEDSRFEKPVLPASTAAQPSESAPSPSSTSPSSSSPPQP